MFLMYGSGWVEVAWFHFSSIKLKRHGPSAPLIPYSSQVTLIYYVFNFTSVTLMIQDFVYPVQTSL